MPSAPLHRTKEFDRVLALMEAAEEHIFVTGRAGTGKSTLLRHFMSTTTRRVAVLAPTGLAAVNVGGQTIHSFFRFPPRPLHADDVRPIPSQKKLFEQLDTLIIDEISMVRADVLDAIDLALRLNRGRLEVPFGGVQIIAFGDLLQLAPVVEQAFGEFFAERYETPYFFSANVLRHCDWQLVELTHNHRQGKDPDFFQLLTRLGHNDMSERDFERLNERVSLSGAGEDVVVLTSTNAAASSINSQRLEALPGEFAMYEADIRGDFEDSSFPTDPSLYLKPGAQVMLLRNDADRRWVNGDIGTIEQCSSDKVLVRLRDHVHEIEPVSWDRVRYALRHEDNRLIREPMGTFKQFPLALAWAITIHKSQGQTLKHVVVDLGRGAFAHGQVYVALSRCESLDGLWLRGPLLPTDIRFDDRVLSFLRRASVF